MALQFGDRVRVSTITTGFGPAVLGPAVYGHQAATGVITNGSLVRYVIEDLPEWEVGSGTYFAGPPESISRDTVSSSSGGPGVHINLSGRATIFIAPDAAFLNFLAADAGLWTAGQVTAIGPSLQITSETLDLASSVHAIIATGPNIVINAGTIDLAPDISISDSLTILGTTEGISVPNAASNYINGALQVGSDLTVGTAIAVHGTDTAINSDEFNVTATLGVFIAGPNSGGLSLGLTNVALNGATGSISMGPSGNIIQGFGTIAWNVEGPGLFVNFNPVASQAGSGVAITTDGTISIDDQITVAGTTASTTLTPTDGVRSFLVNLGTVATTINIAPGLYPAQRQEVIIQQGATPVIVTLGTTVVFGTSITSFTATPAAHAVDRLLFELGTDGTHWPLIAVNQGFTV